MKKLKNFISRHKVHSTAIILVGVICFAWYLLANPGLIANAVHVNVVANNITADGTVRILSTGPGTKLEISGGTRFSYELEHDVYYMDIVPVGNNGDVQYEFRMTDYDGLQDQAALTIRGQDGNINISSDLTDSTGRILTVPPGMIAMFDTNCPSGWTRLTALDGKFLVGGTSYNTAAGGSDSITLAVVNLPSHTHGAGTLGADSAGSHSHGTTDPGHTHDIPKSWGGSGSGGVWGAWSEEGRWLGCYVKTDDRNYNKLSRRTHSHHFRVNRRNWFWHRF